MVSLVLFVNFHWFLHFRPATLKRCLGTEDTRQFQMLFLFQEPTCCFSFCKLILICAKMESLSKKFFTLFLLRTAQDSWQTGPVPIPSSSAAMPLICADCFASLKNAWMSLENVIKAAYVTLKSLCNFLHYYCHYRRVKYLCWRRWSNPTPWQTLTFRLVDKSLSGPSCLWSMASISFFKKKLENWFSWPQYTCILGWWSIPDAYKPRGVNAASG